MGYGNPIIPMQYIIILDNPQRCWSESDGATANHFDVARESKLLTKNYRICS